MKKLIPLLLLLACEPTETTIVRLSATSCVVDAATDHAVTEAGYDADDAPFDASHDGMHDSAFPDALFDVIIEASPEAAVDSGPPPTKLECARGAITTVVNVILENWSWEHLFAAKAEVQSAGMGFPSGYCNLDHVTDRCVPPHETSIDLEEDPRHLTSKFGINGGTMDRWIEYDQSQGTNLPHPASASSATPIVITTPGAHGLANGDAVNGISCTGAPNANGYRHVTVIDSTHFSLNGTIGSGTSTKCVYDKLVFCSDPLDSRCNRNVMSYRSAATVGKVWQYADAFTYGPIFEGGYGFSSPAHAQAVSAYDSGKLVAGVCTNNANPVGSTYVGCWTPLTRLLHEAGVEWKYFEGGPKPGPYTGGNQPFNMALCSGQECPPVMPNGVSDYWKPLRSFTMVTADGEQAKNVATLDEFYLATRTTEALPPVMWFAPSENMSFHPQVSHVGTSQKFLVALLNRLQNHPAWDQMVVIVTWDDAGGFASARVPPSLDSHGAGAATPMLVISPFASRTLMNGTYTKDAILKLIEDLFLSSRRLDPATMSWADPRPTVRENAAGTGDLLDSLDYGRLCGTTTPLMPLFLAQ